MGCEFVTSKTLAFAVASALSACAAPHKPDAGPAPVPWLHIDHSGDHVAVAPAVEVRADDAREFGGRGPFVSGVAVSPLHRSGCVRSYLKMKDVRGLERRAAGAITPRIQLAVYQGRNCYNRYSWQERYACPL